jgi:hypothetical protein
MRAPDYPDSVKIWNKQLEQVREQIMDHGAVEMSRMEIERELTRIDRELLSRLLRVKKNAESLKRKLAAVDVNLGAAGRVVAEAYDAQKKREHARPKKFISAVEHFLHRAERPVKFKPSAMDAAAHEKIEAMLKRSREILADCRQYAIEVDKAVKQEHGHDGYKLSAMTVEELNAHWEMSKRRVENLGLSQDVTLLLMMKKIDWDLSGLRLSINGLQCALMQVEMLGRLMQRLADGEADAFLSLIDRGLPKAASSEPAEVKMPLQAKA